MSYVRNDRPSLFLSDSEQGSGSNARLSPLLVARQPAAGAAGAAHGASPSSGQPAPAAASAAAPHRDLVVEGVGWFVRIEQSWVSREAY